MERLLPDRIEAVFHLALGVHGPALAMVFETGQFHCDELLWQNLSLRANDGLLRLDYEWPGYGKPNPPWPELVLPESPVAPGKIRLLDPLPFTPPGWRRIAVPVAPEGREPPPARAVGKERRRCEPWREKAGNLNLSIATTEGALAVPMPVFEMVGRHAPLRSHRVIHPPPRQETMSRVPRPILPEEEAGLRALYDFCWEVLHSLWRETKPESGLPCGYVATAEDGFKESLFVWDSCFTVLGLAYAWRGFPVTANLDCLYARQEDGGYLHRQNSIRDNTPQIFEPGFGPNPPLMPIAEWALYRLTADKSRLAKIYPCLAEQFAWLLFNRHLPDGTFWTTGLANGLDNSPSEADGFPDLTAQMAHFAETLARMATALERTTEAASWQKQQRAIARALNRRLWDPEREIYAASLPGGGHNPHKVITAFWPLWAGIVPADRVEALARHATDPASFARHHPLPSLAADSPLYSTEGSYWRGSVWSPTNVATLLGFWRVGCGDLARSIAHRHLTVMHDVWKLTGCIWENYAPTPPRAEIGARKTTPGPQPTPSSSSSKSCSGSNPMPPAKPCVGRPGPACAPEWNITLSAVQPSTSSPSPRHLAKSKSPFATTNPSRCTYPALPDNSPPARTNGKPRFLDAKRLARSPTPLLFPSFECEAPRVDRAVPALSGRRGGDRMEAGSSARACRGPSAAGVASSRPELAIHARDPPLWPVRRVATSRSCLPARIGEMRQELPGCRAIRSDPPSAPAPASFPVKLRLDCKSNSPLVAFQ